MKKTLCMLLLGVLLLSFGCSSWESNTPEEAVVSISSSPVPTAKPVPSPAPTASPTPVPTPEPSPEAPDFSIIAYAAPYSYERLWEDAKALAAAYPDTCAMGSIGTSEKGKRIPVLRLGDGTAPCHVLVLGGLQGRDYMTPLLSMALAESYLVPGPGEGFCIHVIPMLNPDGSIISQSQEIPYRIREIYKSDLELGLTALPPADYLKSWNANAAGAELTLNFDALWKSMEKTQPSASSYKGRRVESESETKALVAYMEEVGFAAALHYMPGNDAIGWQCITGAGEDTETAALALASVLQPATGYVLADGSSPGGFREWAGLGLGIPAVTLLPMDENHSLSQEAFYALWRRNRGVFESFGRWAAVMSGALPLAQVQNVK